MHQDWQPRSWQQELIDQISQPCPQNNYQVYWYVDPLGGAGKTTICDYIEKNFRGRLFSRCSYSAAIKMWTGQKIALFDFTRTDQKHVNYAVIESLLDGRFYKNGKCVHHQKPWVICFSNFEPNYVMMSQGRWCIRKLSSEQNKPDEYKSISINLPTDPFAVISNNI